MRSKTGEKDGLALSAGEKIQGQDRADHERRQDLQEYNEVITKLNDMKPITQNRLLILQMIYCFAGVMYNVGSLLALRNGQPAWASTDPVF